MTQHKQDRAKAQEEIDNREQTLISARTLAKTAPNILAALAGIEWFDKHDGAECPKNKIPTPSDLAPWLPDHTGTLRDDDITRKTRERELDLFFAIIHANTDAGGTIDYGNDHVLDALRRVGSFSLYATPGYDETFDVEDLARFHIEELHELWIYGCTFLKKKRRHPLALIIQAWQTRVEPLTSRHIHVPAKMSESGKLPARPMARAPAIPWFAAGAIEVAGLETIEVEGDPLASPSPGTMAIYRRRRLLPSDDLFGGPRTLAGERIDDVLIRALAETPLTGDERSPLRSDIYRTALAAFALSGATDIPEEAGAVFLGGAVTEANIKRWYAAVHAARTISVVVNPRTGEWRDLVIASAHKSGLDIGPPSWWTKDVGCSAWRLTGGLWRPARIGIENGPRGPDTGYWGGLHRTINGLESALTWGPTAGKGRGARIPNSLRSERKGGPGPEVFVPWHAVLRLSGEPVDESTPYRGAHGQRYSTRVKTLIEAGYETPTDARGHPTWAAAPAGDTIEIRQQRGGPGKPAGLHVRASARFCEAYAKSQQRRNWELLPASRLFSAEQAQA